MTELTEIKVFATGKTVPFIESGTAIIKIENGLVTVGKLNYDLDVDWSLEIEHPKNEYELNPIAMDVILKSKPEYLKSKDSIIVTCPANIEFKMKW